MNWYSDAFWLSALVEVTMKGSVVLLAAAVLNLALRRSSAAARHLVWGVALLSLPLLPLLALMLPSWSIPVSRTVRPAVRSVVSWMAVDERPVAVPGAQAQAQTQPASVDTSAVAAAPRRLSWIGTVWVGGVVIAIAPWLIGMAAARRQVRRGRPLASAAWHAIVADLTASLGIRGPVRVLAADGAVMPMTWGLLRPVILLPKDAESWCAERQMMVLAHELAHVKRRDCLAQTVVRIVGGLYWFHPLSWYAARQFLKERERAADDLVLGLGTKASDYAQQLLEFARSFATPRAAWAALAIARRSGLEGRLLAILDTTRKRDGIARAGAAATLAAFACLVPLLAMVTPVEAKPAASASAPQVAGEPAKPAPPPSVDARTQVSRETLPATQALTEYPQLDRLAESQLANGEYDLARETYQRSLEAREKAFGPSSAEAAAGLLNLGRAVRVADGLEKAEAVYRRALDLLGTRPQPELLEYLGMLAQFRKEYGQSDEFYRRALALVGPDTLDAARIITHQALSAEVQGNAPQAEQLYRQAMAIAQSRGPETPQMAVTLEHLARLLRDSARGAEADDAMARALQIRVRHIAERWPDEKNASAGGPPARVGGAVSAPVVVRKVEPRYDDEARLARYQSTVVLSVVVGADGQVHNVRLKQSAGYGLDERAVESVKQWRFQPAVREGQPVPVLATIEVNFRLL